MKNEVGSADDQIVIGSNILCAIHVSTACSVPVRRFKQKESRFIHQPAVLLIYTTKHNLSNSFAHIQIAQQTLLNV